MFALKNTPQNAMELLIEANSLTHQAFWLSLPYVLAASLCMAFPRNALYFVPNVFPMLPINISLMLTIMIAYGIALWLLSACFIRMNSLCAQNPLTVYDTFRLAGRKWLPLLLFFIIYGLLILSSTMALIVPALFLLFASAFGVILLLTHNLSFTQSLMVSMRWVQGHWWHTFCTLIIPIIGFATILMVMFNMEIKFMDHRIPSFKLFFQIPLLLLELWFIPFMMSVAIVLLHDLKSRSHGKRPARS